MKTFKETERLIIREITLDDVNGLWQLDSDPDVVRYVGNTPVTSLEQCKAIVNRVQQQYNDFGIGRWAMVEKKSGKFIGWTGLQFVNEDINGYVNYYDLGYRLIKGFWGQGFATEGAIASLDYGFEVLKLNEIYARADSRNKASRHVLEKVGLTFKEEFLHQNIQHDWFSITKEEWEK